MRGSLCLNFSFSVGLLLTLFLPMLARGAEITVLQSAALPAYNSARQGFTEILSRDIPSRGQKAIQAHGITTHILAEAASPVQIRRQIVDGRPDLLVAIGSSSLSLVKDIPDIPVLYLMVPFPEAIDRAAAITGINMNISAAQQLEALTQAAPGVKSIGILYDPQRTGNLVEEGLEYAARNHLNLVALPVRGAQGVPGQLAALKGKIDWLWMVPDLTVLTPQSVDYFLLFSLENRVPIFTFAKKYLDLGAVLSVTFDPYDMGRQAGELALKILNKTGPANPPPEEPRKVVVESNLEAARILGISLEEGAEAR